MHQNSKHISQHMGLKVIKIYNIDPGVYDSPYEVENNKLTFNVEIDMNNQKIVGVKEGTDDSDGINGLQLENQMKLLQSQLLNMVTTVRLQIEDQIKSFQKSYYKEIFPKYYFDLQDPNTFNMAATYGSNIESVPNKLILKTVPV